MSSHVHWALLAGSQPSAALIKPLHVGFAHWLNARERRLGPVFADRHRSLVVEGDTAAALIAYLHNNPVRAGVVGDPADSTWTSHRAYLGLEPAPPWLDVELGLHLCGYSATPSGRLAFHDMVRARSLEPRCKAYDDIALAEARTRAREQHGGPVELSTPTASGDDADLRVSFPVFVPADCSVRLPWRGDPSLVLQRVTHATGISVAELQAKTRRRAVSDARRIALLVWTRELQRPTVELARTLGLSSSAASNLIATAPIASIAHAAELGRALRMLT